MPMDILCRIMVGVWDIRPQTSVGRLWCQRHLGLLPIGTVGHGQWFMPVAQVPSIIKAMEGDGLDVRELRH
jgi:hypothetical protein